MRPSTQASSLSFLFALSVLQGCAPQPPNTLGQHNAIWSESIYFRGHNPRTGERLTEERIKQYAETLERHRIKYVYLFAGPYGKDGRLPAYAFSETAIQSVAAFQRYYPELHVLPWVGGVQNKTVYLDDSSWVENAIQDTQRLIETLGTSGVHVDLEYIEAGEPYLDSTIQREKPGDWEAYGHNVNAFHRRLRAALPTAFISSVVLATSPDTRPWKRKTSMDELQGLIPYIDQLSFLYYDTNLHDQRSFEDNCESLLEDIQTLHRQRDIQYLIAIGTFINPLPLQQYRNLTIESIANTLTTIKTKASAVNPSTPLVDGIAIWSEWEIDAKEWKQIDRHWGAR